MNLARAIAGGYNEHYLMNIASERGMFEPGYCACGCGEATRLAERSRPREGIVSGQPQRFVHNHHTRRPAVDRFWEKVDKNGPIPEHAPWLGRCWVWLYATANGYGRFWDGKNLVQAHRFSYELLQPIPDGLELDHLCRNHSCVNPTHAEPVPTIVNLMRGEGPAAQNARKTHCLGGHPLSGPNLRMVGSVRTCRACQAIRGRERDRGKETEARRNRRRAQRLSQIKAEK